MALVSDVFQQNGWGVIEFQEELEKVDFKPQLLGNLKLFESVYSRSKTIVIASKDRTLTLIPTSSTGAPPTELIPKGAKARKFEAVRLAKGSTVYAIELEGVVNLPFSVQTKTVAEEVAARTHSIMDDMELTWEHMRFGAIQGRVLDSDGVTVLYDWYTEWGISEPAELDFELDDPATDVRKKCRDLKRAMAVAGKGVWRADSSIGALVGDVFYDMLVNHAQIKETKLGNERARLLENVEGFSSIEIEGITFINYRGTDDGTTIAIGDEKARFFPINAPGAFKVGWAPANEFKEYLNHPGKEFFTLLLEDTSGRGEWDRVEMYSFPLFMCTRPEMLMRAKAK